jgi:hypothetical protein
MSGENFCSGAKMQDALSTMGLRAGGFDSEVLKAAFRRESLRVHPDRQGSDSAFIHLKNCYNRLKKFLKETGGPPPTHAELKRGVVPAEPRGSAKEMNLPAFNLAFEREHGSGDTDGHGEWLSAEVPQDRACPDKVPFEEFAGTFAKMARRNSLALTVKAVPVVPSACCTLAPGGMAGDATNDYSSGVTGSAKLAYTDLRLAHDQQIIDPEEAAAFARTKAPELAKRLRRALERRAR